jgi:hypothetical protein
MATAKRTYEVGGVMVEVKVRRVEGEPHLRYLVAEANGLRRTLMISRRGPGHGNWRMEGAPVGVKGWESIDAACATLAVAFAWDMTH